MPVPRWMIFTGLALRALCRIAWIGDFCTCSCKVLQEGSGIWWDRRAATHILSTLVCWKWKVVVDRDHGMWSTGLHSKLSRSLCCSRRGGFDSASQAPTPDCPVVESDELQPPASYDSIARIGDSSYRHFEEIGSTR